MTTTTEPRKILNEFQKKFQAIYSNQPDVDGSETNIKNFLNSDGDTQPLNELYAQKSKITEEEFHEMEGPLSDSELTNTLMNLMKGASAPGIDGFTVT